MATITNILPSNAPLVLDNRLMDPNWYRYFTGQNRAANAAVAGEVTTLPGSGLDGGGAVSDGIDLSIAPGGVTNAMLRNSIGTSVIGRFQNSAGDPADIQAIQNRTALQRQGDQLGFSTTVDVPNVICDDFRIDQAPVAEVVVCTHTVTISVNGVDYKIPIVAA